MKKLFSIFIAVGIIVLPLFLFVFAEQADTENNMIFEYSNAATWNSSDKGFSVSTVSVIDNKNFTTARKLTITDSAKYFAQKTESSLYAESNSSESNISEWALNQNAEIRFWIKAPHALSFSLKLNGKFGSSYKSITASVSVPASDLWQEIRIARSSFSTGKDFNAVITDAGTVYTQIVTAADSTDFLTQDEALYISPIYFYNCAVSQELDPIGGTIIELEKLAEYNNDAWNANDKGYTVDTSTVTDNYNFIKARRLTVTNSEVYYSQKVTTTMFSGTSTDDSAIKIWTINPDAEMRFWIKTPGEISFTLKLDAYTGTAYKSTTTTVSTSLYEGWQEIRIPRSQFSEAADFNEAVSGGIKLYIQIITSQGSETFLEENEVLLISPVEFYNTSLTEELDSTGGTIPNEFLVKTDNEFWINDWNRDRERSITSKMLGLPKTSPYYGCFSRYRTLEVVDADTYYSDRTDACFYFEKKTDISYCLNTGTLRFWIDVPKDMTVRFRLVSVDENGKWGRAYVDVPVKATAQSDEFQEIRIALKEFSQASKLQNSGWNPTYIRYIEMGGVSDCTADTFLAEGEVLSVSPFEIWPGVADDLKPYDATPKYYGIRGDVFVRDINGILANTSMVNSFKNTLEKEKYKAITEDCYAGTSLMELYSVNIISANLDEYCITQVGDYIEIYIPVSESVIGSDLLIGIYDDAGIEICDYCISDNYLVIITNKLGNVLVIDKSNYSGYGYINDDDVIDIRDLIRMKKVIAGNKKDVIAADLNKNNYFDAEDMMLMRKYLLGILTSF